MDTIFLKKVFDKETKVIIFGAGERGRRAAKILDDLDIHCVAFLDNDNKKQGTLLDDIPVYSPDYLESYPDAMIIISMADSGSIYKDLSLKYQNVYPTESVDTLYRLSYLDCERYGYNRIEEIGNFNSPYPNINSCQKTQNNGIESIKDINFQKQKQLKMFEELLNTYAEFPYQKGHSTSLRYYEMNTTYGIVDAFVLFGMLRLFKPMRIIEIGSGFSSAVMLDINELFYDNKIELTFIEPRPNRLNKLLKKMDKIQLKECDLQDVDLEIFDTLCSGDILFVDSSHLVKRGSDVNRIFFDILPRLKSGVNIHFHDIMSDFEYPMEWIKNGWIWNESYLLRAFLMNNSEYEVVFFTDMWNAKFKECNLFEEFVGGANIWIRKL